MSLTESLTASEAGGLSQLLTEINEIDKQLDDMAAEEKRLKKKREYLAGLAVDEMQTSRLDGVKVAGRSWRIELDHSMSVLKENRQAAIEVAERLGMAEELVTISTGTLKSYLREKAKAAGRPADQDWASGTEFDGLVSEYVRPVLRHLTTG